MVSGNPSSSSLVTDNSLANRHHPAAQRRSFPEGISGAAGERHAAHAETLPDRKSPTGAFTHGLDDRVPRTDIVAAAKCTSRAFPPRDPRGFFLSRAPVIFTRSISLHLKLADNRLIVFSLSLASGIVISRPPERCSRCSVLDLFPSFAF